MKNNKNLIFTTIAATFISCFTYVISQTKPAIEPKSQDTLIRPNIIALPTDSIFTDKGLKLKPYKKNAHASYYADRFNGRKTADGSRFNNNKYTAAHKKLPFGTRVKVTNEANGKFVIVKITDRGPFVKTREIDLSKRAFMEITKHKGAGAMKVTIETIIE